MEDDVDLKYRNKGTYYNEYQKSKKLVKDSEDQLNAVIETMDEKILQRIRENEHTYHAAVMKYLKEKEQELRTVLKRMEDKSAMVDGKDILIGKMHTLVNKIEADGRALLDRLKRNEESTREIRDVMDEMTRDHAFMIDKVKKEKFKCRKQQNLILTLKEKTTRLEIALTARDKEIKDLELKLLRCNNKIVDGRKRYSSAELIKEGPEDSSEQVVLDGVMITQRGQKLAEKKDSLFCPFTYNGKFETFLEDLFDMKIYQSNIKKQIQDYVKCLETHYTDIITKLRFKNKKQKFEAQKERGRFAVEKDRRSELEEILIDAIDKTRL